MKDLITNLSDMGILASPEAVYLLSNQKDPLGIVREILAGRGELLILEESDVNLALDEIQRYNHDVGVKGSGFPEPQNGSETFPISGNGSGTPHIAAGPGWNENPKSEIKEYARREPVLATDGSHRDVGLKAGNDVSEGIGAGFREFGNNSEKQEIEIEIGEDGLVENSGNERIESPTSKFGSATIIRNVNLLEHIEQSNGDAISLTKPLIPLRGVDRYRPIAAEYEVDIDISGDITGKSLCEGKLSDFSRYFTDRLTRLRAIIKSKPEMMHAIPISRARTKNSEVAIIGIVSKVINGEKGISIEVEDEDAMLQVFISKTRNPRLIKDVGAILNDEVIGVIGNVRPGRGGRGPSLYPKSIIRPPLPFRHNPSYAMQDVSAAFVSDLHLGSKTFQKTEWKRCLSFLNGKHPETREVASRIKYLVFTGDIVDGIGVYPGHDEDLDITDLFLQYEAVAEDLNSLPDHIKVILAPGNHDGVRKAEPQPALPEEIQKLFDRSRVQFTGNPNTINLHGVKFLTYHGGGMDDIIPAVLGLTYEQPIGAMKEMMMRRHLAPIYGGKTPLAPEHRDYLLIDEIPDVFVTGHVHTTQIDTFHNVLMVNASCWMAQTAYQKMRDFVPDPSKLPVVRLDTLKPTLVQFGE
jgi:DNA polymerase II small subunit